MNLTKKQNKMKDEIKTIFLTFFKSQYVKYLAAQKLK